MVKRGEKDGKESYLEQYRGQIHLRCQGSKMAKTERSPQFEVRWTLLLEMVTNTPSSVN